MADPTLGTAQPQRAQQPSDRRRGDAALLRRSPRLRHGSGSLPSAMPSNRGVER
jgi:hypothetical protein